MSDKKKKAKAAEPAAETPKEVKAPKGLTYEQAKENHAAAIKTRQAARAVLEKFEKDNGLMPKKKHGDDPKHGKAWKPLNKVWKEAKDKEVEAEAIMKSLKPVTQRLSGKYDYPADCTSSDAKKKFRAAARTAAKAAEKAAAKGEDKPTKKDKAAKAEGKSKKDEAPKVEEKPAKKEGKDKKKKKKVAAED